MSKRVWLPAVLLMAIPYALMVRGEAKRDQPIDPVVTQEQEVLIPRRVMALLDQAARNRIANRATAKMFRLFSDWLGWDAGLFDSCETNGTLLINIENYEQIKDEWRNFWFKDQPSHLTFDRIHGGIE